MTTRMILGTAAVLTAFVAGPAFADSIDRSQYNQQKRIEQGIRSGQLTRHEAARLEAEQSHIAAMERRAKADGYVDPWERRQIAAAQNRAGRDIFREKHDGDSRWTQRWRRWW